ncbi:MAG: response regulator [Candidatus Synoicihabitans palmerolidicus]|nr:response regulator [Candidatus Synoicihabitans palmerolidicus]
MKRKILIVDDALTMRKLVAFTLRGAGLDVVEAPDGVDALSTLARQSFDLIIPDVNMPRMDGIPLTRQARATPNGRSVPILILTTESEVSKKNEGRAAGAGATGWIVKPFQQDQLLSVVARVLPGAVRAHAT